MNGDVQNAFVFVKDNWGEPMMHKFGQEEVYLVIETLMHFQYSEKSSESKTISGSEAYKELRNSYLLLSNGDLLAKATDEVQDAFYLGLYDYDEVRSAIIKALDRQYSKLGPTYFEKVISAGWNLLGNSTFVGTPANMIKYRNDVLQSSTSGIR